MGVKIKEKIYLKIRDLLINEIINPIKGINLALKYNESFAPYRGCFAGKDIYIIGSGPTERFFVSNKKDKNIYIGINLAYRDRRIVFDFLFAQDQFADGMEEMLSYKEDSCIKFLGIIPDDRIEYRISDNSKKMINASRYALAGRKMAEMPVDISIEPVADLHGTVFSALQFAFFTNPDHIYLVGFDCSSDNSFIGKKHEYSYQLKSWKRIRSFAENNNILDRLISINPVGLKGYFKDQYTIEYIESNDLYDLSEEERYL